MSPRMHLGQPSGRLGSWDRRALLSQSSFLVARLLSPLFTTHPRNRACNSFVCHTSKSTGLKVLYLPHIQKTGGCPPLQVLLMRPCGEQGVQSCGPTGKASFPVEDGDGCWRPWRTNPGRAGDQVGRVVLGLVNRRISQPSPNSVAPQRKTRTIGGSLHNTSMSPACVSSGHSSIEPAPKSCTIWAACSGSCGNALRFGRAESASISCWVKPSPSEDLRRRKIPLTRSERLPSPNTIGVTVDLTSRGERNQKENAPMARTR
jgi:hypothetical protein